MLVAAAAIGVAALLGTGTWLFAGWHAASHSVSLSRLRVAAVTQGTLVRDASVNGRVVAAVSPTLYAPAVSTVTLKVNAGDRVRKGQVLAVLESPDLSSALRREESSFAETQAEIARQEIIGKAGTRRPCTPIALLSLSRRAAVHFFHRALADPALDPMLRAEATRLNYKLGPLRP